jgi:hypothetical protein
MNSRTEAPAAILPMGNQFFGAAGSLLMRDRDKSNWVLRLVPAPHHSDGPHGDSIPVIERERRGAKVDDSDLDSSTGTTDAGPLFW